MISNVLLLSTVVSIGLLIYVLIWYIDVLVLILMCVVIVVCNVCAIVDVRNAVRPYDNMDFVCFMANDRFESDKYGIEDVESNSVVQEYESEISDISSSVD